VGHVPNTIVTQYPGGDPSDVFSNPLYAPPHGYDKVSSFMDMYFEMSTVTGDIKVQLYTLKYVVKICAEILVT
jgi:hypothetical protein